MITKILIYVKISLIMAKKINTPLEKLFGSKTRAKLLELFFSNMGKSYYVREITRVIEEQINSVRRELTNLNNLGLIQAESYENKIYYSANKKHPFAKPMQELFAKNVDTGEAIEVRRVTWEDSIKPVERELKALVITNRLPGQDGLDMLVVGDDRMRKLTRWAETIEKRQGRPVNYAVLSLDDYLYRKSVKDRFIAELWDLEISDTIDPENIL